MKESYDEGRASHTDPDSCTDVDKGRRETVHLPVFPELQFHPGWYLTSTPTISADRETNGSDGWTTG